MIPFHSLARWARRGALTLVGSAALVACGGGSSQVEAFEATRLLTFGDETSTLTADGRKYSVNALTEDGTALDCFELPLWVQSVADLYSLVFAQCNPENVAEPGAVMLAEAGAMAEDLAGQIDTAEAAGGLDQPTIATVLMGANDVLSLYATYPATSEATIVAELQRRGTVVAQQVNRLVGDNVRVLITTIPDLGKSPFARAEREAHADVDRAALLTRLTTAMNTAIRLAIINDGRKLGLILGDELVQAVAKSPGSFSITEAEEVSCAVALPDCTTETLVEGASSTNWLWADGTRLSYAGHYQLGRLARSRASNNPF